jgi:hypothetical protein
MHRSKSEMQKRQKMVRDKEFPWLPQPLKTQTLHRLQQNPLKPLLSDSPVIAETGCS